MVPVRLCYLACSLATAALPAMADECGAQSPSYTAKRTTTIDGQQFVSQVFVSNSDLREEQKLGDKTLVTLRLPEKRLNLAFDPATMKGVRLPDPQGKTIQTRVIDEKAQDGSRLRRLQALSEGNWIDVSRTECSASGIMLHQTATTAGPNGKPTTLDVRQSEIRLVPLPASLFEPPAGLLLPEPADVPRPVR